MGKAKPFLPVSSLIGAPVSDVDGIPVGHVVEILVDDVEARIAYLQFCMEPSTEAPARTLTIPWSTTEPHADKGKSLTLRVHRSALEALAGRDAG